MFLSELLKVLFNYHCQHAVSVVRTSRYGQTCGIFYLYIIILISLCLSYSMHSYYLPNIKSMLDYSISSIVLTNKCYFFQHNSLSLFFMLINYFQAKPLIEVCVSLTSLLNPYQYL